MTMTAPYPPYPTDVIPVSYVHRGCGGSVTVLQDYWEDWFCWVDMPVCEIHGGPVIEREIIFSQVN